jgi:hypothetical protein
VAVKNNIKTYRLRKAESSVEFASRGQSVKHKPKKIVSVRSPLPAAVRNLGKRILIESDGLAAKFEQDRYVVLGSLMGEPALSFFYQHALERVKSGTMLLNDPDVPNTPSAYADPSMEVLLKKLLPFIERATALKIYPTYSYFRVYKEGDVLAKHTDRQSCEISLTLNLGYCADKPWPLWIQAPRGVSSVEMKAGDGVLYRGIECVHWREAFAGEHAAQVFLHYVDRNGRYAEWKFDKRNGPGRRLT